MLGSWEGEKERRAEDQKVGRLEKKKARRSDDKKLRY